jgi:hypothetical protein
LQPYTHPIYQLIAARGFSKFLICFLLVLIAVLLFFGMHKESGIVLFVTVSIGVVAAILVDNLSDIPRLRRETDEAIAGGWPSPEPQPLPRQREQPQE